MNKKDSIEIWFVTGSQHLYGEAVLKDVASNSNQIVATLNESKKVPLKVVFKPVVVTTEDIRQTCLEANHAPQCAGLILWMHTFSPAKMWITGLGLLQKPFLHLHTQFNRDLPWSEINMDFMNLNQAAHGDREAGFLHARMRLPRKVVVGHWSEADVHERVGSWMCAVRAWYDMQGARFARFADNMRQVAVTEGDKIAAEARLGFSVNGYGVGDLAAYVNDAGDAAVTTLCTEYAETYRVSPELKKGGARHESLRYAARQEIGIRAFLEEGNFKGFTTNFEVLHGLKQLPGLAVQRLMADGYGFGGEGDWKTCALLRFMKVVAGNGHASASFMEEYTYHLDPSGPLVLGAHMLEVCPSIAEGKPNMEIHPLSIGGKDDPVRLVFNARPGKAITASLIDLGNRFRIVASEVEVQDPLQPLPKLPVARAVWRCKPDFKTAAAAWLYAGGCHHTALSYDVTREQLEDFAEIAGVELVMIDGETTIPDFKQQLRTNEVYYHLAPGIGR